MVLPYLIAEDVETLEDLGELVMAEDDFQELGSTVEQGALLWPALQAAKGEGREVARGAAKQVDGGDLDWLMAGDEEEDDNPFADLAAMLDD